MPTDELLSGTNLNTSRVYVLNLVVVYLYLIPHRRADVCAVGFCGVRTGIESSTISIRTPEWCGVTNVHCLAICVAYFEIVYLQASELCVRIVGRRLDDARSLPPMIMCLDSSNCIALESSLML